MKKHIHGGNIYQYENCLDFSANCNPLGTPESVIEAASESLRHIAAYPRVGCGPLREAIGQYENVPPENIICGNGAADLIFSLCRAVRPKNALLPAPTFAEYEQALRSCGDCTVEYYFLKEDEDFRLQSSFLEALHKELDIVFLCNPNNPTGMLTNRELLLEVLKKCRELDILLVVDECFLDFVRNPGDYTLKEQLLQYENLFLLKAFTKRYAMAGIRLGYGLTGNRRLLQDMEAVTQPWNVSTVAQAAGIAALKEREYVEAGRQLVFRESLSLRKSLKKLGLQVFPSKANYVFFKGPEDFFESCVQEGILIRDCSNYPGLSKGYYRIAVRKPEENRRLVEAFTRIRKKGR
ncbi:MAG: pyridoxal phosphate-dependent class II aminotransferase [Eubacteriales bacterium]|nr:pyridoxal phosphate-dependent class II aminotransferase [Eubacteriales bacterium]